MTEAYPIINEASKLRKVGDFPFSPVVEKDLSFLYIGSSDNMLKCFSAYFREGAFAGNFTEAKKSIQEFGKNNQPDAIFIDQSLDERELREFSSFLKEKNLSARTIIIYNEERLDAIKVKFLQQNELVDDVVNIDCREINYSAKIAFLKKIKSRQGSFSANLGGLTEKSKDVIRQKSSPVKRTIDVILASIILLVLLPVLLLIALAIKLESRGKGPVMYISKRAGRGFKVFDFYKFRTMEVNADQRIKEVLHLNQYGANDKEAKFLKIQNDPRVTRVGRFLRNTSLDELPQFLNVLKGDMSLVGNRPLPLYEATTLTTNDSVERFMAPAGITGLWQIKKRGKEDMSAEERINLDILYARNASFTYDLWIMAQTPSVLFQKSDV
jgi:lipopolysaccharide/colanic/teichoic acid biosynthesis glycosyltransferase